MQGRSQALQSLVASAAAAFDAHAQDPDSRLSIGRIFESLTTPMPSSAGAGSRLPVCAHLEEALGTAVAARPSLARLVEDFRAVEPFLVWRRRSFDETASANFEDGHANAMIVGPGGYEDRRDVWLGVTLMAPNVRYPDHTHAPEEVYLVLSKGEFRNGPSGWFAPGVGGSFYNTPGIVHAMRSLDAPLLAFWALRSEA